jgi:hypothetical protein
LLGFCSTEIVSIDMVLHREMKRKHGNQCHKVLCLYNTETNIKEIPDNEIKTMKT